MKPILVITAVVLALWSGSLSAASKGKPVPSSEEPTAGEVEEDMPAPGESTSATGVSGSGTCNSASLEQLKTQQAVQQCLTPSGHEARVECLLGLIAVKSSCQCGAACPSSSTTGGLPSEMVGDPVQPAPPPIKPMKKKGR